jgi:hypothetical protein
MTPLAPLMLALAMAGPNGLQTLHNPSAEQNRQDQMMDRLNIPASEALPAPRRPAGPPTEAEKKAAAWRADHLSCASRKGRGPAQYAAECKPAREN